MFSSYLDFEVTIEPMDSTGYALIVRAPGGDARGRLSLSTNDNTYHTLLKRLEVLDIDESSAEQLGQMLFYALFQDSIKEVYARSQGVLRNGQGLRLVLNIAATEPALAALPWEYLTDPDQGALALRDISIVRYLPQQAVIPRLRTGLPLKILLTGAETPPEPDIERELDAVQLALATLGSFVQITVEPHLTIGKLQRLLRSDDFHVWHFIGHGGLDRDGATGRLALEDEAGDAAFVTAPELGILLNRSSIRLVILSACNGAKITAPSFRSVAPALVRAQIPAVVAQQFAVPQEVTRAFASEFYQALAESFPIDACVTEGRKAIMSLTGLSRPDWGIPVVYTRAPDGMLFDLPPLPKPPCPYPGMAPFYAKDARFFYGRESEITQILMHLRYQQTLFIIGPSGSGKSSLVHAGVLPQLAASSLFPNGFWLVREIRPGAQPLVALTNAVNGDLAQPTSVVQILLDTHPPTQKLLLVIDQFEEVFAHVNLDDCHAFILAIQKLRESTNCTLLIMLRADFYPDLMNSELWPIDATQRLEITPLRGARLRQAIEQPAVDVGVRLEPGLTERLLGDSADEPGVLPLVQETMVLLWDRMVGRLLTQTSYSELGRDGRSGLATAIATKANAVLAELTGDQQIIARRIFLRLIQFGEGRADTRRQLPLSELRAQGDSRVFDQTVQRLADSRLLTLSGEAEDTDRHVDMAHEVLIDSWPMLHSWLEQRRGAEQMRRRLEAQADEWVRLKRGSGGLLDAIELPEAEQWLASPDATELGVSDELSALIKASSAALNAQAARQRQSTRLRRFTLSTVVVLIVAILSLAIWYQTRLAYQQGQLAAQEAAARGTAEAFGNEQQQLAEERASAITQAEAQTHLANARFANTLAVQAQTEPDRYAERNLLLAVEAVSRTLPIGELRVPAAEQALRDALFHVGGTQSLVGHTDQIKAVVFSSDGRLILTSGRDNTARVWLTPETEQDPEMRVRFFANPSPNGQGGYIWHTGFVNAVAFNKDSDLMLFGNQDGSVQLWGLKADSRVDKPINVMQAHQAAIRGVAISPDGRWIVTGSEDHSARLWQLQETITATLAVNLAGHTSAVTSVAFSPDGHWIITGSEDHTARIWDRESANPSSNAIVLTGHTSAVTSVAFSPDGRWIVTGSEDHTARIWDRESANPSSNAIVLTDHTGAVTSVAFSPDGRWIVTGSEDLTARVWNISASDVIVHSIVRIEHKDSVTAVAFSPNGHWVLTGSQDGIARLWDWQMMKTPASASILRGHTSSVNAVAISADGRWVLSGSADATARLWDREAADSSATAIILTGHKAAIRAVAISPDGRWLLTGSEDHTARLWDRQARDPSASATVLIGHTAPITSVAFSPDGRWMLTGSEDSTARLWDREATDPSASPVIFTGHKGAIRAVAFNPTGDEVLTGSEDHTVRQWSRQTQVYTSTMIPSSADLPPQTISPIPSQIMFPASILGFSESGRAVLVGHPFSGLVMLIVMQQANSSSNGVYYWPITGVADAISLSPASGVSSVGFSSDGNIIIGSSDTIVRVWDLKAANPANSIIKLRGHQGSVKAVSSSANGRWIVTGSSDGTVRLWERRPEDLIVRACHMASRNLTQDEWQQYFGQEPYHVTCSNLPVHSTVIQGLVDQGK